LLAFADDNQVIADLDVCLRIRNQFDCLVEPRERNDPKLGKTILELDNRVAAEFARQFDPNFL
jgi:hypothetical protein